MCAYVHACVCMHVCATKPIAPISCTPRVQEAHTKAEVVHPTPGHMFIHTYIHAIYMHNIMCTTRTCVRKHTVELISLCVLI